MTFQSLYAWTMIVSERSLGRGWGGAVGEVSEKALKFSGSWEDGNLEGGSGWGRGSRKGGRRVSSQKMWMNNTRDLSLSANAIRST